MLNPYATPRKQAQPTAKMAWPAKTTLSGLILLIVGLQEGTLGQHSLQTKGFPCRQQDALVTEHRPKNPVPGKDR